MPSVLAPLAAGRDVTVFTATHCPHGFYSGRDVGGAFLQGSGSQLCDDGTERARRGVVVVTVNDRLGPLGLFAHPALTAEAAPGDPLGNYCLLDMMEGLRWVKRNISPFGGDPNNVTISGSSAGGTCCLSRSSRAWKRGQAPPLVYGHTTSYGDFRGGASPVVQANVDSLRNHSENPARNRFTDGGER